MNSEPRPAPPEISSRSGSAPLHRSRQLLWASAPLLLACLLVSRPADAQSFGLGLSTASGSAPSQSSVWVGVRLGLHGSPTYGRGVSWTSPGQTFGHRPRPRRWRSHSPAVWSVWPACWDVVRGPLPRGFHGCSPPWGYGFRWSRPAFAWAHYPLPLPYGGHSYLGDGVRSGGWSLSPAPLLRPTLRVRLAWRTQVRSGRVRSLCRLPVRPLGRPPGLLRDTWTPLGHPERATRASDRRTAASREWWLGLPGSSEEGNGFALRPYSRRDDPHSGHRPGR